MAEECLAWGLQPSEHKDLTRAERSAFNHMAARLNDRRK